MAARSVHVVRQFLPNEYAIERPRASTRATQQLRLRRVARRQGTRLFATRRFRPAAARYNAAAREARARPSDRRGGGEGTSPDAAAARKIDKNRRPALPTDDDIFVSPRVARHVLAHRV